MPTHVIAEGAVDRAVVSRFAIVPEGNLLPSRSGRPHAGREDAMRTAALECLALPEKTIVLLLDLNGHWKEPEKITAEARRVFTLAWSAEGTIEGRYVRHKHGKIRVEFAGLPEGLAGFGFSRFMMDDYLVELIRDEPSFAAFVAGEANLPWKALGKTHADLQTLVGKVVELSRTSGVAIDTSKRWLDLARGIIGFQATRATMAEALLKRAPAVSLERITGPLRTALQTD